MPAAPSWSSAERTRAGSFSPVATMTSAPAASRRVGRGARRRARDDDGQRELRRAADELGVERQARLGVEHDAARLARGALDARRSAAGRRPARCRCRPRPRRARRASGARARRDSSPEIHFESPVCVATLPSSVIADLKSTCGRPVRACLRKGWLSRRARAASSPSATTTSMPSSRRIPRPRPAGLLGRVVGGDDDAGDARLDDRVGARAASCRGGSTARATRRSSPRPRRPRRRRRAPRARRAARRTAACQPSPSDLAVAHDDGADQRVRARPRRDRARRSRWRARGGRGRCRAGCSRSSAGYGASHAQSASCSR